MGMCHPNHRRVKAHRSYTVEELAQLCDVHENTVRAWRKAGLSPVDDDRPTLFKGQTVSAFLKDRREKAKKPCGAGMIFCLPCREPKRPAGDWADYVPITATTGNLRGICPACDRLIHRRVNWTRIGSVAGDLHVRFTTAEPRLRECGIPPVKCDFEHGATGP